jgi:hypothetical protein
MQTILDAKKLWGQICTSKVKPKEFLRLRLSMNVMIPGEREELFTFLYPLPLDHQITCHGGPHGLDLCHGCPPRMEKYCVYSP